MFGKIQFEVKAIRAGRIATPGAPATLVLEVSVDTEMTLAAGQVPSGIMPGPRVSVEVEDTPEARVSYGQKWETDTWTEVSA